MPIKVAYALPGTALSGGVKVVLEQVVRLNRFPWFEALAVAAGPFPDWFGTRRIPLVSRDPLSFDFSDCDVLITTFYTQRTLQKRWAHKNPLHFCQGFEGDYAEAVGKAHHRPVIDAFYRNASVILTVNESLRRRLKSFGGRVFVVGQATDHRIFCPGPKAGNTAPKILIPGAFDLPFKGVQKALAIARMAQARRPDLKVLRVSPADTREAERDDCTADQYHVGLQPDRMAELYRSASLVLCLPHQEGFGLPVIEAMACGTPVLAARIPPFQEICRHRYPLFDASDPARLADQVLDLLNRPDILRAMRNTGLRIAATYRYGKVMRKLVPLLLAAGGRAFAQRATEPPIRMDPWQ